MDDPLKQFIGRDISEAIDNVTVMEGKAKQTGSPYTYLNVTFSNGFSTRIYLDAGGKFAVSQAISQI